jgi:hypothetical protein
MNDKSDSKIMPKVINQHLANVYPSLAMMAGMQLEVFTAIGEESKDLDSIAGILEVRPEKLRPLLYALVTAGLLVVEKNNFQNNQEAKEFLIKGKPRYIGNMHSAYSDLWASTMHTAESIRTGQPQAEHDFGNMSKTELRAFVRGLDAGASATARRLQKEFDMGRFENILDAGGGSGGLAIALSRLCPNVKLTVADLSNVTPVTKECVLEANLSDRVSVKECDLVNQKIEGAYDAIIMRSVLQVLGPEQAETALSNAASSLSLNGELYMVGRVLDDSRLTPIDSVAVNVMFLNVYQEGQAYTESEYNSFFMSAGLEKVTRTPLSGGYSIIRGTKVRET